MRVYGPGMHDYILDELEFGKRVAREWDNVRAWGAATAYWWLAHEIKDA